MKQLCILFCLAVILPICYATNYTNSIDQTAFVKASNPSTTFGSAVYNYLMMETDATGAVAGKVYIGINLSLDSLSYSASSLLSAVLILEKNLSRTNTAFTQGEKVAVYYCADSNLFTETTITWNNQATDVTGCELTPFTYLNASQTIHEVDLVGVAKTRSTNQFVLKFEISDASETKYLSWARTTPYIRVNEFETYKISVYDEDTGDQLLYSAIMNNNTQYVSYDYLWNGIFMPDDLPSGNVTITVSANGYADRSIFIENSATNYTEHKIYLVNSTTASAVIFRITTINGATGIENAELQFYKLIGTTMTFLGEARTDSSGYTFFFIDPTETYKIVLSATDYTTQTLNTIYGKEDYEIRMSTTGATSTNLFNDFAYFFTPKSRTITSIPLNISAYVIDTNNLITNISLVIKGDNTSYYNTTTNPAGAIFTAGIINSSNRYYVYLNVTRQNNTYTFNTVYNYWPVSNTSLIEVSQEMTATEHNGERILVILLVIVIVAVFGAIFSPAIGAMLSIAPAIFFIYMSWLPIGIGAIFILITIMGVLYFGR